VRQSKVCNKCGELKPLSDFYAMKGMRDGHRNDCIECNKAAKRARQAANPEPYRERARQWALENPERLAAYRKEYRKRPEVKRRQRDAYYRRVYGKSADEVDEIVDLQGGRCLICKGELPERLGSRHLDHDHATGAIRGVLCIDCNHGIGKLKDDPDLLLRAVVYLREGGFLELLQAM
jgi:hypothetical protein